MADIQPSLKFDPVILERLRHARLIQLYLSAYETSCSDAQFPGPNSYFCAKVFVKTDHEEFCRIQSYLTEDEQGYDDIDSIELLPGWLHSSGRRYMKRNGIYALDDEPVWPLDREDLMLYETIGMGNRVTIGTRSSSYEELDHTIVFTDGERTVYVTGDITYSALVTHDLAIALRWSRELSSWGKKGLASQSSPDPKEAAAVPIGRAGLIKRGRRAGWYLWVQDDQEHTGGYLVFETPDRNRPRREEYDNWVENEEQLKRLFANEGWEVDWEVG